MKIGDIVHVKGKIDLYVIQYIYEYENNTHIEVNRINIDPYWYYCLAVVENDLTPCILGNINDDVQERKTNRSERTVSRGKWNAGRTRDVHRPVSGKTFRGVSPRSK